MATAISYGPARMGFGLFVPEFQDAFSLSSSMVGIVSSLGFAGFFIGLLVAQFLLDRRGPEFPVLTGLAAATIGMGIVTLTPNLAVLAAGVFLAASSAGFAWTPFNDAVHRKVRNADRATALSEISTGTAVGIALTGSISLAMALLEFNWRYCWAIFTAASALALLANWAALRQIDKAPDPTPDTEWSDLLQWKALPLFGVAFVFGITSAIYISFAPDQFARHGVPGVPDKSASSFVFISYGLFGLAGLATSRVKDLLGLPWLLRVLLIASAVSLALVAMLSGRWAGLIPSAGLQGINVMMTSAVLAVWSERLFPAFPSLGFTATLLATAAGSVIGPAFAGWALDGLGAAPMFLGTAAIPLAAAAGVRRRLVIDSSDGPNG